MTRNFAITSFLTVGASLCTTAAMAETVIFGSANDGLGGFTQSTPPDTQESWSTETNSVKYTNDGSIDGGTRNSSLLKSFTLNRSAGQSYTVEGTLTLTDLDPDDNNRVGIYLFGDSAVVPNQLEAGAISVLFNTDDGGDSPSDTNADDDLSLTIGIDAGTIIPEVDRIQTPAAVGDLKGTQVKFTATIAFDNRLFDHDGDGGSVTPEQLTDVIDVEGFLFAGGETTATGVATVVAADYTGDFFGFVTRARNRDGVNSPFIMDYESFTVVPEPGSLALLGLGGLCLMRRRASVSRA